MDDRVFDLVTKMYSELTSKIDSIDTKLDSKADKQDIVLIENKMGNDIKVLYDGYKQTYEKLVEMDKKIDDISNKVDRQEVEITVIKGGKKAKAKYFL